ncbi:SGNH hydrolase [Wolfiporia cocos MD-104 SS10]|uniref:SGNH hydrolase n=1 Tax=Wolfiporia cocos (strain MD-104) TaxID=742152 RepID=A0A2H3JPD0_WOLCO|nr:SGNH hydrolase [Wolfiporia cocos MD-104 SS10]
MAANVQNVIMLVGDSITQGGWEPNGFAQQLAYVYNRKMDVINRGMSGYNTEWIIPVFEQCFATQHEQQHAPKVRILTIWLGANDAALPGTAQHVPLPAYGENLARMIRMVTSPESAWYSPDTRVLLLTPPPVNTYQWRERQAMKEPPRGLDRDFAVTQSYAERAAQVAREEGVAVVDIWTRMWDACGRVEEQLSELLSDGLHLTEKGYAIVFDEIIKTISENYPELHYDRLKPVFPFFDQINYDDPRSSLTRMNAFD